MISEEEVYMIGQMGKPHGVRGEMEMRLADEEPALAHTAYIVVMVDGLLVPFFFEDCRWKNHHTAIVKLEGVDTKEQAEALTGCDAFLPIGKHAADAPLPSWSLLTGFMIINDADGTAVAPIASVDTATDNVLLELENGILLPAAEELMVAIDYDKKTLRMAIPEGLLTLNDNTRPIR